jgi:hypothetical protein
MSFRLLGIAACLVACGCASTQLNYNTADLATSLNSLTKRQIFFNLAQAVTDPEFVPSQATISVGTAQTMNSVAPSISAPLGNPVLTTTRVGNTIGAGAAADFVSTAVSSAIPTLGVQVVDAWNQSWTMSPITSSTQLRRLRALYQYATGALPRRDRTVDLTLEEAEKQFLCEYPIQGLAVAPHSENIVFKIEGCPNNDTRGVRIRHADPTFVQGVGCVICVDDLNAKQLRPYVNPNLKYHLLRTQKTGDMVSVGSYGAIEFYVCDSSDGNCPRVVGQAPFDGHKAFSDFILFVHEATLVATSGGSGRSSGGNFVYSVR